MKYLSVIVLLFFCACISAQIDIPELDRMLKYGEVESLDITFRRIEHSKEFIDKFNLNDQELEIIGFWGKNYTVNIDQTGTGVRILGMNVYPNRIISITLLYEERGIRKRAFLFALWKMEKCDFLIKPLHLLIVKNDQSIFDFESVVDMDSSKYYSIGHVGVFEKAYVLRNQLDFSVINAYLSGLPFTLGKDSLRYRILYEPAIPSIYQRIGTDDNLKKFLLNPVYTDTEYFRELIRSHSRSYTTEYVIP